MQEDREIHSTRGALLIIAGAAMWGVCFYLGKVNGNSQNALLFTWWISLSAAVISFLLPGGSLHSLYAQFRAHPIRYIGIASTGMVIGNTLLYYALARLELTLCSLLERSQPIFVVILSRIWLKEYISKRTFWFCFLALFGTSLLFVKDISSLSLENAEPSAVMAIIGTGFAWAVSTIFGKSLATEGFPPRDICVLRFLLSTLIFIPILLIFFPWKEIIPSKELLYSSAGIAFFGVMGFLLYYKGLKEVTASRSAFLELSQPLVGVLLGLFALHETLTSFQWVGVGVLLYAVLRLTQK